MSKQTDQDRRDAKAWAQEWQIRQKNLRIVKVVAAIAIIALLYFAIKFITVFTTRTTFSSEEAMRRVSDEFVNYDRLAGRNRIYLENIGLLWFYNFKLRMLKVHLDMLKNNPARVLLNYLNPISLPTPMADSIVGKGLSGGLSYTTGLDMGLNSWRLLPFLQLFGHL